MSRSPRTLRGAALAGAPVEVPLRRPRPREVEPETPEGILPLSQMLPQAFGPEHLRK